MKKINLLIITLITLKCFSQDFEVSPVKLYFNAEPGESQTKHLMVKNHSNKTETFIINVSDFTINNIGKSEYLEAGSLKNSIADWISISPSFYELEPNEQKEITITMQQPTDDYSSKWGVLFIRTAEEQTAYTADKSLSTGMNISARIVVNIFQTPSSNNNYKATIGHLTEIDSKTDSIRQFSAIVNNIEDIITSCKVFLIATDIQNGQEQSFPPYQFTLLPKSSRKLILELPKSLPKGTYSLAAILDYGSRSNLEGTQMMITID